MIDMIKSDFDKLKYIIKNGTCHITLLCCDCPLNCTKNLDNFEYDIVKESKKLLNELRTNKLERIMNG